MTSPNGRAHFDASTCAHPLEELKRNEVVDDDVVFLGFKCLACGMKFVPRPEDSWMRPDEEREAAGFIIETVYGGPHGALTREDFLYRIPQVKEALILKAIGDPAVNLAASILGKAGADSLIPIQYQTGEAEE